MTLAAVLFALLAVGVIVFQLALALGVPWGAYAMGGAYPGRFPPRLRVAAVIQALVIAAMAIVVLSAADLVVPAVLDAYPWLIWLPVAFSAVSTVLNAITRSPIERRIWLPVAAGMLISSLVVALGL